MITHDVEQGSAEWLALRARYNTASEAPAMMGASKYLSREELLRQKATGIVPEVGASKQALFDRGHETEAAAREIVEEILGESLYPVTASSEEHPTLLASFDGLTMDEFTAGYEHKLWNEELADMVRAEDLSPHYYWQLEQELLISGAEKIIFVTSDGTRDRFESMEYRPVPGRAEALIAGWAQFDKDRAAYVHVEPTIAPVAAAVPNLPTLSLQFAGSVMVHSNLDVFAEAVRARIGQINLSPKTDQEFADGKAIVSDLEDREKKAKVVLDLFLNQNAEVSAVVTTVKDLLKLMADTRNHLDRTIKAKEASRKVELQNEHRDALAAHIAGLNKSLGRALMPAIEVDWAGLCKGMRSFDSMSDKLKGALATAKIAASDRAEKIRANLAWLTENASDHKSLLADYTTLVLKDQEAMVAIVSQRIAEHKAAEKQREAEIIRKANITARINHIKSGVASAQACATAAQVSALIEQVMALPTDGFDEFAAEAATARGTTLARMKEIHDAKAQAETSVPAAAKAQLEEINESMRPLAAVGEPAGQATRSRPAAVVAKKTRPTDDEIIGLLALHYRVHESKVLEWLLAMDLEAASNRMAEAI